MILKALFTLVTLGANVALAMTMLLACTALGFFIWLAYQRASRSTLAHVGLLTYTRKRLTHQAYKHTPHPAIYMLWVTPLILLEKAIPVSPERKGQNTNEFVY